MEISAQVSELTDDQLTAFQTWVRGKTTKPSNNKANAWLTQKLGASLQPVFAGNIIYQVFKERDSPVEPDTPIRTPAEDAAGGRTIRGLPGFGELVNYIPQDNNRFPVLVGERVDDFHAATLLIREVCMLEAIESFTHEPEWWIKIRDPKSPSNGRSSSWRQIGLVVTSLQTSRLPWLCVAELTKKANLYGSTSLIPILDYSVCVIKSDKLIDDNLRNKLGKALKGIETHCDDWSHSKKGKILSLLDPSLWPVVYGRTRILHDRHIGIEDCLHCCGKGWLLDERTQGGLDEYRWDEDEIASLSLKYQWLPCNVNVDDDGMAKLDSYINNLRPERHRELYDVLE
ncbi:hypothetical protein ACHAQH_006298 [Verticillium albo-atrum]